MFKILHRTMHIYLTCVTLFLFSLPAFAQPDSEELQRQTQKFRNGSFQLFHELLSIPNDAHYPDHIEQNVEWMTDAFRKRSFTTTLLETGGPPLLLAERSVAEDLKTVLIYLQIDGQPVDSSAWFQESPYDPELKEEVGGEWQTIPWDRLSGEINPDWRIFARSASDAKGPVGMFLTALDAFDDVGFEQLYNIKVIMDFEEELGSPHLPGAVEKHRDALASDMLIIYDGPRHISNQPSLTFGARGIAMVTLTVYGPRVPQHSGHFGNYAPNPAIRLAQILATMEDEEGRVTLPGFYDGIELDEGTREILAMVPDDEEAIQRNIGIAKPEAVGSTYQEAIQYPSLNIRGMRSAWVGNEVRTIVPATATAEIDLRLTPESEPERLIGLVKEHVLGMGYHLIDGEEPSESERATHPKIAKFESRIAYQAFRTPFDSEVGLWLDSAMLRAFGVTPIKKRMSGGSIPISPFITTLGIPAVTVPTVNSDNNQHSPNENLRVGNYIDGITTFLAILTEPLE